MDEGIERSNIGRRRVERWNVSGSMRNEGVEGSNIGRMGVKGHSIGRIQSEASNRRRNEGTNMTTSDRRAIGRSNIGRREIAR